ncbi:MAG TPA: response regulator transcription factor [Anaerolineae bacterium]|nr:response regulator transcription factor [Anaerolineae bacterium]HQK15640.1 response regulator transcription factor [Anaerolineae bacterium]
MLPIRVLIADDHRLFRQGLRQICETVGHFEVVGEAENGQEAVELTQQLKPDVVLMDVSMPVMDGVEATRLINAGVPSARIIILTMYRQDRYVFEAIKAGARGYLLKDIDEQELVDAVRAVHRGEALIDPGLAVRLLEEFRRLSQGAADAEDLTPAEMDVLRLVAQGLDNKSIARELNLSERTVVNRLSEIYQKLHVASRTQAALVALRRGWARLDETQSSKEYDKD